MRVREHETELVAVDAARQFGVVDLGEWEKLDGDADLHDGRDLGYAPERRMRVRTDRVEAPPVAATVIDAPSGERETLTEGESLPVGPDTLVVLRTPVLIHVRPTTTGEIRHGIDETVVDFGGPVDVSLGFESKVQFSDRTVRVEESAEGIAAALNAMSPVDATSPDRTWPAARERPPAVEFARENRRNADTFETPDTDVSITVSGADPLDHLFPVAPLAYYLDATVSVDRDSEVTELRAGTESWSLGESPETVDRTASEWLQRIFYLDCHARRAGPHGERLAGGEILDERLGLDAGRLYEASMAERVQTYLGISESDAEAVAEAVPTWHLGVHVEPTLDRAKTLPQHLGRLADIYRPESATLETVGEQVSWSQRQRVRGGTAVASEPTVMVAPDQSRAETVGWDVTYSDGSHRAVGAFNVGDEPTTPRPLDDSDLSVTVVRASSRFGAADVVEQYERRVEDLPMTVDFVGSPTAEELERIIADDHDLLHIVGHKEPDKGIECRDNTYLSVLDITECGAEAFFLNACGTLDFGERLVETGAAAGVATTRKVTDEDAAAVGDKWAWLMAEGWAVERATDVVRRLHDPSGYVTLGGGTHLLREADTGVPPEFVVEKTGDEDEPWRVEASYNGPRRVGRREENPLEEIRHLRGDRRTCSVSEEEMVAFAEQVENPVVYDDSLVRLQTLLN